MLQEMRKFSKSWIANIFLGLLTLSFVSWGVGDMLRGSTNTAVATVGGTPISQVEFQRDYSNTLRQLGDRRGKAISPAEARKEGLGNQLLQQSIFRVVLDNVVNRLKLTASDAMVSQTIRSLSAFAGPTGSFDRQTFLQRISQLNYTEQGFIEIVRQDTARNQLVHAMQGGIEIPHGYARALFDYFTEVRAVDYITVTPKALAATPTPSDTVLEAYIKAHADKFSTPEYRDVTYAWASPEDVMGEIKVSEDQIKQYYQENLDQYVTVAKRDIQQINYPGEAEAKAAYAKIKAGESFEKAAAARGEKPSDIDLGEFVEADLEPAIGAEQAKAVFALPEGGITEPLKTTSGGWAIIRVTKVTGGVTKTLADVKDEIKKQIANTQAQSKLVDIANAYIDDSSKGLGLVKAAKDAGMHTAHIPAMDAEGLGPDGKPTAALKNADFRKLVFQAEVGEEGDPQALKDGTYVVIAVNGIIPPKLKPLDKVRKQAVEAWTAERRAALLKKKAEALTALANKDKSLDPAAKSIGAKIVSSPGLNRRTSDTTFSADAIRAIFNAKPDETVYGPAGSGGGYIVARVTGVVHPPFTAKEPGYKQGLAMLSRGIATGITDSFVAAQRKKQGVQIDNKLLNSVIGGEGS